MKKFTNYRYITDNKTIVIALSTYAGKSIKGIAKCSEEDTFDLEYGKRLAAARCNQKVMSKRFNRINQKEVNLENQLIELKKQLAETSSRKVEILEDYIEAMNDTHYVWQERR